MPQNNPHWSQIRSLFEVLIDRPAERREALIANAGLDEAAVAELRSLLQHHDQHATGFLGTPAEPAAAADNSPTLQAAMAGQRLGAWQIVRPIGQGGMGEVFEARRADGSFEGRAAVKLLKRGMDSAAVLQRFAQERQALARLNHPHIARLLDAGASAEGLPYFVMEFVDGRAIHLATPQLTLDQRLRLFLQLTDAVAYAHRSLLVHRDLKPGNVLVDTEGQIKLLDFGIAKALDPLEGSDGQDAQTTAGSARPFTPNYASPEQVRGEPVTTATDIYSLGVLLYQMLTGARPTGRHATTALEAARCVLEEEPTRPSRLSPAEAADPHWLVARKRLEGDLDNILLKALDKRVSHRYGSVDALSADIQAYLQGHPVSARAASLGYIAAKFVGRNRWAVMTAGVGALGLLTALAATVLQGRLAAALGVLALAAGLVMALVQARQAALSRDAAARARDDARQQLERVKRITTDLVFRYGDTVTLMPGGMAAQEALLRDSIALLEPALLGAPDDLDLMATMASALGRLAEILGNSTTASPHRAADAQGTVLRALKLAERAWQHRLGDWRFASWHVRTRVVQAQLLRGQGELAQAQDVLNQAAAEAQASLAKQTTGEGRVYMATGLANVHLLTAQICDHANLPSLGRPMDALRAYGESERIMRELLTRPEELQELDRKAPPGDAACEVYLMHQIAAIHGGRALVHLRREDLPSALQAMEAAMPLRRLVVEREPRTPAWRDGLMTEANTWALVLIRLRQWPQALEAAELAWQTAQALAADEGPDSKWAGAVVKASLAAQYGRALAGNGQHGQALEVLTQGLQYWQAQAQSRLPTLDASTQRRLAWHQVQMAGQLAALSRSLEATEWAEKALCGLLPWLDDSAHGRDARLVTAEAHALLMTLQPARSQEHRTAAVAVLHQAQTQLPPGRLGADHEALLQRLQL